MIDALEVAEEVLGDVAASNDLCAVALLAELKRLRAIEAAAKAQREAHDDYCAEEAGSDAERLAAMRLIHAQRALYRALGAL